MLVQHSPYTLPLIIVLMFGAFVFNLADSYRQHHRPVAVQATQQP